jgi:hypothetical protein
MTSMAHGHGVDDLGTKTYMWRGDKILQRELRMPGNNDIIINQKANRANMLQ